MKRIGCICICVLLNCLVLSGQPTDSLWSVWRNDQLADTTRLVALQTLAYAFVHNEPDSTMAIAGLELAFAKDRDLPLWEAKALNLMGLSNRFKGNLSAAMSNYEKSLVILEALGDKKNTAAVLGNMGDIYRLRSDFPKAVECLTKCLRLSEEAGDRNKAANAYVSIATIFLEDPGNSPKAMEYLEKARLIYEDLKAEQGLALVYGNLAAIYLRQADYGQALVYTEKTLAIQEKMGDEHGAATTLFNRATIHGDQGRIREALADFDKVIGVFHKMGDQEGLADAYIGMGNLWLDQKRYPMAITGCEKGLAKALVLGSPNVKEVDACHCLYQAYREQGNYKLAVQYLEQMSFAKDSLQLQETAEKLKEMEISQRSVADSLNLEKERLQVEKTLRKKDRAMSILAVIGLGVLLIALAFLGRMLYFQRRSQQFQARSVELEKQQLLNEIALLRTQVNPHFLFNSLSILSSLVHIDPNLSEQFIEQLSRSYRYILEQKEFTLVTLRTELEFIKSYAFLLKIRFQDKFDLQFEIPEDSLDQKKIAPLTLQLLIENAVKHNRMSLKEPLTITVSVGENGMLEIKNRLQPRSSATNSTGVGLKNIKDRYALLTNQEVWAGAIDSDFVVKVPLL